MNTQVVALLAALLVGVSQYATPGMTHAQSPPGVIVAPATVLDFPLVVEALGNARANESIEVRPRITAAVTDIRFSDGEHVSKGEILLVLQDAELQADVAEAKATLLDSASKYERAQQLLASELISSSQFESVKAQRDAHRASLAAAEARLAEAIVRAPFAGRVGLRRISVGSLVGPSTVITTLDDTDTIKLDFDIPETALARAETGLSVIAKSAAWPESTFLGFVQSVDTRVDPVSRTVTVRALIPNPSGLLRPGMFLTVKLLREDIEALMIPEHAVVPEQSRQFVLVIDDAGIVDKREVEVGRRRPGQVEIVAGLSAGELVVVEGTQKARPGNPVTIVSRKAVNP